MICILCVAIMFFFSLRFQDFKSFHDLKKKNSDLKILASVGGSLVSSDTFRELVDPSSNLDVIANFTLSLASFVEENRLDGVEVDWQWPGEGDGPSSKDDLTSFFKVR